MKNINLENFIEYVIKKYPDVSKVKNFEEIIDLDNLDEPYMMSGVLYDFLLKKNRFMFLGYKKGINEMFYFINDMYKIGDDKIEEMIAIQFIHPISASITLKRKAKKLLDLEPKKDLI